MTTYQEIFTFSWPLRGRGGGGQPKRSAWPLFSRFFLWFPLCWLREKNDFWQLTLVSLKTYAIWYYSGYGSEAAMIFSCANGHKLHGAPSVHCSILGEWGAEQPTCKCESSFPSPLLLLLFLSGYLWHSWLRRAWPNCWIWAQLWWFSCHYLQARFQTSR